MIMYFAFKTYPGGGAFALFFHPHPREFATKTKKVLMPGGQPGGGGGWAQLELTDALGFLSCNSFSPWPSVSIKKACMGMLEFSVR